MRIGIDVGGTNTDAVLIDGSHVLASVKQPTTKNISAGIIDAIHAVLESANVSPNAIRAVMIGTTHFTNALVESARLDKVAVIRLASPSGDALPPMMAWPEKLTRQIGQNYFLLPGGYEFDGREISSFDENKLRDVSRHCKALGIKSFAISCAFAPMNPAMELHAAKILREEHPDASISLSHEIGRLGIVERENGVILNAALATLAQHVIASFKHALNQLGLSAPLFISQNDGTLISSMQAVRYPVMTIGSGPTNSMRGAAFLTGIRDGIVMDVGGTTCDIGVLSNGMPRESSIADDISGIRTNFRMPDILAIGLGGGTRIHLNPDKYLAEEISSEDFQIGPDSVGYQITKESYLFGGKALTASDIAVMAGKVSFGDPTNAPKLSANVKDTIWQCIQSMLEDGVDRMKTSSGDTSIIAVGGGHFFISDTIKGASKVVRPEHASVANAVGAAIAQVGAQIDKIIDYDKVPRDTALAGLRKAVSSRVVAAGAMRDTIEIVEIDEVALSYLPGRAAQVRMKAVGDLADLNATADISDHSFRKASHAH
ncbi:hydantoinase/oxoprolinase N-terminal domain-containing protein [Hyphococcus sp. DH-69]|uniref:hydantoinase/oxoprolinase N-terminal domain-containing protein n=1 Tax=Hyphococcus formosus TaxID=3143534 RepID=UPI00398A6EAA